MPPMDGLNCHLGQPGSGQPGQLVLILAGNSFLVWPEISLWPDNHYQTTRTDTNLQPSESESEPDCINIKFMCDWPLMAFGKENYFLKSSFHIFNFSD